MPQRITNSMLVSNYNRNLNAATVRMEKLQTQLATGRKIARLSDDPVNVIKSLTARSRLNDIEQYKRNLDDASTWLTATETALTELNEVIKRAYELSVQASSDVLTNDDRDAISHELVQLRDHVVTLGNSTLGDKFIFGGYNVSSAPFIVDDDDPGIIYYCGGDDQRQDMSDNIAVDYLKYEINVGNAYYYDDDVQDAFYGDTSLFDVGISGADFMGVGTYEGVQKDDDGNFTEDVDWSNNIYITMHEFFVALNHVEQIELNGEGLEVLHKDVQPFMERLLDLQKNTLTQMTDVGGRMARIELMQQRYATDIVNYTQMQSDVEDLDQAEAVMWFSMAEAVYRSSLSMGGRVLPPSLMDFMR